MLIDFAETVESDISYKLFKIVDTTLKGELWRGACGPTTLGDGGVHAVVGGFKRCIQLEPCNAGGIPLGGRPLKVAEEVSDLFQ